MDVLDPANEPFYLYPEVFKFGNLKLDFNASASASPNIFLVKGPFINYVDKQGEGVRQMSTIKYKLM